MKGWFEGLSILLFLSCAAIFFGGEETKHLSKAANVPISPIFPCNGRPPPMDQRRTLRLFAAKPEQELQHAALQVMTNLAS